MTATPFHFGDSNRRLYGVYHLPEARKPNAAACLLLNPFGEEAIRSHRIFKQLAERLSRAGSPVLRFDYYGSGDSEGDCADIDFDGMVQDAATAHEELEALSGVRRFAWVGLGLGGAVALRAAEGLRPGLAKLFLWDPVLDGAEYLKGLRNSHVATLATALDAPASRIERETPKRLTQALGFALPNAFRSQLSEYCFAGGKKLAHECHLIGESGRTDIVDTLIGTAPAFSAYAGETADWNSEDAMNAYVVPAGVIDYIATKTDGAS